MWCPELAQNSGGIEAYSADLLRALVELFGPQTVRVFTKHDTTAQLGKAWGTEIRCRGTGAAPKRLRTAAFAAVISTAGLRYRPDLIISTHVNFSPIADRLKQMTGCRYMLALHGIDVWGLRHQQRRRGIANADLNIAISKYTAGRVVKEQAISPERIKVLRCIVDASHFAVGPKPDYLLKRYRLTAGQPVILTVGRLSSAERYKGHDRVLRVLKEVAEQLESRKEKLENERPAYAQGSGAVRPPSVGEKADIGQGGKSEEPGGSKVESRKEKVEEEQSAKSQEHPPSQEATARQEGQRKPRDYGAMGRPDDRTSSQPLTSNFQIPTSIRYLIVGDGDDRARLEKLSEELGVADLVTFADRVPPPELADHYRLCDLFAMPSTGEGFGIVFLEALACGKPVLAGNRDAAADPLLDGELGVLVDPDNPQQLASAIVQILSGTYSHPLLYKPEELRRRVIDEFGYERFKDRLQAILEPLIPRSAKG